MSDDCGSVCALESESECDDEAVSEVPESEVGSQVASRCTSVNELDELDKTELFLKGAFRQMDCKLAIVMEAAGVWQEKIVKQFLAQDITKLATMAVRSNGITSSILQRKFGLTLGMATDLKRCAVSAHKDWNKWLDSEGNDYVNEVGSSERDAKGMPLDRDDHSILICPHVVNGGIGVPFLFRLWRKHGPRC